MRQLQQVFPKPKGEEERAVKGTFYKAAMYGLWKSDNNIVPEKPANKKVKPFAEQVEGGALTEGNSLNAAADRTQGRGAASISLQGVRRKAQQDKGVRFNNLFHHITTELLTESFYSLKKNTAAGVDEMTWHEYKKGLAHLCERKNNTKQNQHVTSCTSVLMALQIFYIYNNYSYLLGFIYF